MSKEVKSAYYGSFFHAPVYGEFEYLEDALIEVDGDGVIVRVVTGDDPCKSDLLEAYRNRGMLVELGEGRFGLPGFVDIHVHAPQWPQAALALDEPFTGLDADNRAAARSDEARMPAALFQQRRKNL